MDSSFILEWSAAIFGTLGTIIWATKSKFSKYCGFLWLVGSIIWILFALKNKHYGLVVNNIIYLVLYVYGIYCWVFKPKAQACNNSNISTKETV